MDAILILIGCLVGGLLAFFALSRFVAALEIWVNTAITDNTPNASQ